MVFPFGERKKSKYVAVRRHLNFSFFIFTFSFYKEIMP